jgi:hypothetical protein
VFGAECSDGITLVADTQLTRGVDKEQESKIDEKITADSEHLIVGQFRLPLFYYYYVTIIEL